MIDYKPFLFSLPLFMGLLLVSPLWPQTQETTPTRIPRASVTISDSTFNPADWSVLESTEGGASQTTRQEPSGGNPGAFRWMQHALPSPPTATTVGRVEVTHIYDAMPYDPGTQGAIDHLDFSEDVGLLGLPWPGAFVSSFPALVQDGQAYRAAVFVLQDSTLGWKSGTSVNLIASDFIALDGSSTKPNFSESGTPITFGFWRIHTRVGDIPVPYGQDITIDHGIDNFSVTVYNEASAITCTIEPQTSTSRAGDIHRLKAILTDGEQPVAGVNVEMEVTSGPNAGLMMTLRTSTNGEVTFIYSGTGGAGTDLIEARGTVEGTGFSCTAQQNWIANRAPIASDDIVVLEDGEGTIKALDNDFDPDDDILIITDVVQPSSGTVTNRTATLSFTPELETIVDFLYIVSDIPLFGSSLSDTAEVTVLADCGCTIDCLARSAFPKSAVQDTVDLGLLRRFRDEVLEPTEVGARYVDLYYNVPELLFMMLISQPELGRQAVRMVEIIQPPLRNLLDGDGNALITQAQVDSVAAFFNDVSLSASESLQQRIADELIRLGPLNDYIGLPVREVVTAILGTSTGTAIEDETQPTPTGFELQQNFPNPFTDTTEIRYVLSHSTPVSLTIYNIQGQKVRTLIQEDQMAGSRSVVWDGLDDGGFEVSSGIYLLRLQTPTSQATKVMVLRK